MNRKLFLLTVVLCSALNLFLAGCESKASATGDPSATAPPPAAVEPDANSSEFKVDHPEQFPFVAAGQHVATPELPVTGVVSPDVSRQVPVPSLATGRVVEIHARLGDEVKKDQLLFKVRSSDIAGAYSDYQKAVKNEKLAVDSEHLAKIQQERAHLLYDNGAVPKSALEIADNAEVAAQTGLENARVDLQTTAEHLKLLGSDVDHPSGIVEVTAPVGGVITDQEITDAAGVTALSSPAPFTISDMSHVWIVCDVYENNLSQVRMGDYADIKLNAYPNRILKGRVSNIGQIMDPNLHTAKVRLEVENPGIMRLGMFVTAIFHGDTAEMHTMVPSTAILHLHDRDWVYTPAAEDGRVRRVEVVSGDMLPGNMQEVVSGLKPGEKVVSNALVLQSTVEQ
jgi:membrane fusion protein, heavy metal efflux system